MVLDFSKDYVLENNVVRLTPLREEHFESLLDIYDDAEIWIYFIDKAYDFESFKLYVKSALKKRAIGKEYPFVVFDKRKNKYAGLTRLYDYSVELNTIRIGHTWYGCGFRGTGLNKHCKYLLFQFIFETLELERIGLGAYIDNDISVAAMKSVGCKQEGVLRNMFPSINGKGRTDAILMSILKSEWNQSIKLELKNKLL